MHFIISLDHFYELCLTVPMYIVHIYASVQSSLQLWIFFFCLPEMNILMLIEKFLDSPFVASLG